MEYEGILYPDGNTLVKESLLNNPEGIKKFIRVYQQVYYWKNNYNVEQKIIKLLMNIEELSEKDIFLILAWKIGGIDHKNSNSKNVEYKKSWNKENLKRKIRKNDKVCEIEYKGIVDILNCFKKQITNDEEVNGTIYADYLKKLMETGEGIGATYATTLMYFASNGLYPIYDQYAGKAMFYIAEEKQERINFGITVKLYIEFVDAIKRYFKEEYSLRNDSLECMERWRAVDQALWAYGEAFNCWKDKSVE